MAVARKATVRGRSSSVRWSELQALLQEIAPLELAADWDNTGLVLEPRRLRGAIRRVLLAIDLSVSVVQEAKRARCDLVVAYHPPIFRGLKRLSVGDPQQAAVMAALDAGIAVYSPHTALDAAAGGLADWLVDCVAGSGQAEHVRPCGEGDFGRAFSLRAPQTVQALLPALRRRLKVRGLRVALPDSGMRHKVRTVAVAAGAGGSVLAGQHADLWLTGELSHHGALAAVREGTAVVCAEHSNTERGYLPVLQRRLQKVLGKALDIRCAKTDTDPFRYV
jgi:dinuclear metal center YbgI/SA1388 family protein